MVYVIGVDTGGTFTDAFATDQDGRIASAKVPSTPPDFARGFLAVLDELAATLGIATSTLLAQTSYLSHGTTSTLNALLTGDVASVGLITTQGHADSVAIMNVEGRYAGLGADEVQNMPRTSKPPPLLPRRRIREVHERVDYKGEVVVPLDEAGVRDAVASLLADGVDAIAVSLLWSFRNPVHELRVRELIREVAPDLYVALSSEVSPRIREYARSATTIMNTQVGPPLRAYLAPLEAALRERGFAGALLVMQGSGGCVTARHAPERALTTIGSVLTGGVVGCGHMAAALGQRNIISTDMGGTTFLVGLVRERRAAMKTTAVLNQYTINVPMVDVQVIGAGGGAIAWLDPGGNLRVGPRSAGARPGPACYGEGGEEPTVTDADVVLGIINPEHFLGGRKRLDRELAAEAIRRQVAEPLGLPVDDAAAAIYAIQNGQTADLVRKVVVNSGQDPRDFVLYSYGGAGPVHCASYAADLGVPEVIVPLGATAAVFSAYGLTASDVVLTAELSQPANFPVPPEEISGVFRSLEKELQARLAEQQLDYAAVAYEREADLRYTMQLAEVPTPVPPGELAEADVAEIGRQFEQQYEILYGKGSGFSDAGLQVITYRLRATGQLPTRPKLPQLAPATTERPSPTGTRQVFLDVRRGWQTTVIYDYRDLAARHRIAGPAVVEAPTTTVALPEGCSARVDALGNLVLRFS